jgi:hypothetical protein
MSLGALTTTFIPLASCISSFSNLYVVLPTGSGVKGPVSTGASQATTTPPQPTITPPGYVLCRIRLLVCRTIPYPQVQKQLLRAAHRLFLPERHSAI